MKAYVRELINQKDFNRVLKDYRLDKYELLSEMSAEIFAYDSTATPKEKEILTDIYKKEASMFNLTDEKVMFISDTHMESEYERLYYFQYILRFCAANQIHYLIHGGDIADGTFVINDGMGNIDKKNITFDEVKTDVVVQQVENILNKYPTHPEVQQLVLGGNHDERYTDKLNLDILKLLATEKKIFPLGYIQAFFTIYGYPISLEHENKNIYPITKVPNLFPESLKIKGHSHIWSFSDEYNAIYLPTFSANINHKNDQAGNFGFVVMNPSKIDDELTLQFDRFYYQSGNIYLDQTPYVLKRKLFA